MHPHVTRVAFVLITLPLAGAALVPTHGYAQPRGVMEASGVTRLGPNLIVVTDSDPGAYYTVPVRDNDAKIIPINAASIRRHAFVASGLASDLEGVDVLPDGRIVALSERLHALVGEGGLVAEYPDFLGEVGGIGLEGLSARAAADGSAVVGVLWEGGYPEEDKMTPAVHRRLHGHALEPTVLVHRLGAGEVVGQVTGDVTILHPRHSAGIEPGALRFRAADLVWHRLDATGQWGFIVLLSASTGTGADTREFGPAVLQRFSADGHPVGPSLDLAQAAPELGRRNWEGMGWFENGQRLVLVHDQPWTGDAVALVIPLDTWPSESPR
jgi:hypothetical protein